MEALLAFFDRMSWQPFPFQQRAWQAYLAGESGLLHAPTGVGKTYAIAGGPMLEALHTAPHRNGSEDAPLAILWVTPMRALAGDTGKALHKLADGIGLDWTIETRTGDTSSSVRARQKKRFPSLLITTPESLSLLLSYPDTRGKMLGLQCVVVDEWHELLGTKRGVQTELCLARLRQWFPALKTWGLSATLGNLQQAMDSLLGSKPAKPGILIRGDAAKKIAVQTLVPRDLRHFPWAGHLGTKLLPEVLALLEKSRSSLIFTNTRSQAELWYQALLLAKPEWESMLAIHHGSLDRDLREQVEEGLRAGSIRYVVCTSSLDLGVDFSPVDQVLQIASPRGVARLIQRAGRSGHQPGATSQITGVPAHALELVEFSAVRTAVERGLVESRRPIAKPLDVLAQHLVTLALGGGFDPDEALQEVKTATAYQTLSDAEWRWTLDFIEHGGQTLRTYPQYAKVQRVDGRYQPVSNRIAQTHRMSIGTITSDSAVAVKFLRGGWLGTVEEALVAKLRKGEHFLFAGRCLQLVNVCDMTAYVRLSTAKNVAVSRWLGGRLPLSSELAGQILLKLEDARNGHFADEEMHAAKPILDIQQRWSALPGIGRLVIEQVRTREGHHLFLYPFAGKLAHEGLAALLSHRLTRRQARSITYRTNDYGIVLLSHDPFDLAQEEWRALLDTDRLLQDILACLNTVELARRQFRDIARVAGLIVQRLPGRNKTTRQLQASSGLLFDVFTQHDPGNLLLDQANREVLENQLEFARLKEVLQHIETLALDIRQPTKLTPFGFPLWAENAQAQVSSESWQRRLQRMAEDLESAATEDTEHAAH